MTESTFSMDRAYLQRLVGRMLIGTTLITDWSPAETGWVNDIISSGLRTFLQGGTQRHKWSFLHPLTSLTTSESYSAGTVAQASGVVTLTGGTWPSWAAEGELTVGGNTFTVASRDSDTQLTLDDTSATNDVAAGTSYQLGRPAYDLPDDVAYVTGPFTYRPGSATLYGPIEQISVEAVRAHRQWTDVISRPQAYTVMPKANSPTTGSPRWQVRFWPTPDGAYPLEYRYRVRLDDITDVNKYPMGSEEHSETIKAAVLAEAELESAGSEGPHHAKFLRCLEASIGIDNETAAEFLGYNHDRSERVDVDARLQARAPGSYVTYEGHNLTY